MKLRALAMVLIPSVMLAAGPAPVTAGTPPPVPDPLDKIVQSYQEHVKKDLSKSYNQYQNVTQPRPELPALALPEETLERLLEVEFLGAVPSAWLKVLNAKGESEQARGQADGVDKPSPDEYRAWEGPNAQVEPSGHPVRGPDEWAAGITAEPDAYKPPFEELAKLQKKGAKVDESYAKAGKAVETAMQARVRASMSKHLKALKATLNPILTKVMPGSPADAPWKSLKSPGVDTAAQRYLAERYFKGKWAAGKAGPKNTMDPGDTAASKQKASLSTGDGDKNSEGSTGDGTAAGGTGDGGTGTGSASPGMPPGPHGTGTGKGTGSGTGPGF